MLARYKMRRNYYKIQKTDMAFIIIVTFVMGIIFASLTLPKAPPEQTSTFEGKTVEVGIPAIGTSGNGVTGRLFATVRQGNGQVLVSINDVLAQYDTQLSARTAAHAASKYSNIDVSNIDIIYTIKVNASAIEGPSAGASMAIATVLAFENVTASPKIMATGSISEDGTILPVGAIYEKAKAARDVGTTLFLVPKGQSVSIKRDRVKSCSYMGTLRYCTIDYKDTTVNIGEQLGIAVKEVNTLDDAVQYYKNQSYA